MFCFIEKLKFFFIRFPVFIEFKSNFPKLFLSELTIFFMLEGKIVINGLFFS